MAKNEREMLQCTQIARLSCLTKGTMNLRIDGKEGPFTVEELISESVDFDEIRKNMEAEGLDFDSADFKTKIKYSDLSKIDKDAIETLDDKSLSWKIVDIHDKTPENGLFACAVETSDKDVCVAFRCSEGMQDYRGAVFDWIRSDFGALNSTDTIQNTETEEYAIELAQKHVLDKYDKIDVAGHSLGGQLASSFAVGCAVSGSTKSILDKLGDVYNFDGQGFSDEYIDMHKDAIEKVSGHITHYKWSPIGNLLYDLPGEKEVFLKTEKYNKDGGLLDRIGYYTFGKHDTRSLEFNENGEAERGKEGILSKALKGISLKLEKYPEQTAAIYSVVSSVLNKFTYQKENGDIGLKLPFVEHPSDEYAESKAQPAEIKKVMGSMIDKTVEYVASILNKNQYQNLAKANNLAVDNIER